MILINGKTADKLTEEDLSTIINNPDYAEGQCLDYKTLFAFDDKSLDKAKRDSEIVEFKKDVCSFANAEGGYVIVGVTEEKGIPQELLGIDIPKGNTDEYKLKIRDKLANIQPKIPSVKIHCVMLQSGKYIVIVEVIADGFTPYVYNMVGNPFDFVIRNGAGKIRMSYNQVMRMFNQSLELNNKIEEFRRSRIKASANLGTPSYLHLYVIPDNFVDVSSHKKVYMISTRELGKIRKPEYANLARPNVDGIKFMRSYSCDYKESTTLYNSGICELELIIEFNDEYGPFGCTYKGKQQLCSLKIWQEDIMKHINYSVQTLLDLGFSSKAFLCFDLSCPVGTITHKEDYVSPTIDRELIVSQPVEIEDMSNEEALKAAKQNLFYEYLMSLGIRDSKVYENLTDNIF